MILNSRSVFLVAVSFVAPVAATSYIDVHANAAYIQPVASVSYIDARVQAEVTFPDLYKVEVITPTDLVALTVNKGFNDFVANIDSTAYSLTKVLADTLTLNDIFYEDLEVLVDAMNIADAQVLASLLQKSDNISTASSGTLEMQNYCDITYFLEPYVGTYLSFT